MKALTAEFGQYFVSDSGDVMKAMTAEFGQYFVSDSGDVYICSDIRTKATDRTLDKESENALRSLLNEYGKKSLKFIPEREFKNLSSKNNSVTSINTARDKKNKKEGPEIGTTVDLKIPKYAVFLTDAVQSISSDHADYFAAVRIDPESSSRVHIYYIDQLTEDDTSIKDSLTMLWSIIRSYPWCTGVDSFSASQTVIGYIRAGFGDGSESDKSDISDVSASERTTQILMEGIQRKASDIHIDLDEDQATATFLFRIDKQIVEYTKMKYEDARQILSNLFNLDKDSGENQIGFQPTQVQKKSIKFQHELKNGAKVSYTIRFQGSPHVKGSKIVLRLLDNDPGSIDEYNWPGMGYADTHVHQIEAALVQKTGFILIVGTTSSGKSTTTAKMLSEINKAHKNWTINTIEDPVEYRLNGVSQHQVDPSLIDKSDGISDEEHAGNVIKFLFKALLRMDPDVVGAGEIRDESMAGTVYKVVNSGHKALATLHAGSVMSTFSRMEDIGLSFDKQTRPGFYSLICYQTLIPKTCDNCAISYSEGKRKMLIPEAELTSIEQLVGANNVSGIRFKNSDGCEYCNKGIKGMTVCAEIMTPSNILCEVLSRGVEADSLNQWRKDNERYANHVDSDYIGVTALEHMLYKLIKGEVCPTSVTDDFKNFETIYWEHNKQFTVSRGIFPTREAV